MPKFLERRLQNEYGANAHAIYGTLNTIGAMRGNKETAKGRALQGKHDRDVQAGKTATAHPHKNLGAYLHKKKSR